MAENITGDHLREGFESPEPIFRPAPFWSWNSVMDHDEIKKQIDDFKEHGFGGAFAHARAGLVTEYLSDEFFDAFRFALDESKRVGNLLYMYDENTWPSGFAGGLVCEREGEENVCGDIAKSRIVDGANPQFGGPLIRAAEWFEGDVLGRDLTDIPLEEWGKYAEKVFVIYLYRPRGDLGCGGHPYIDVMNRRATDAFLEITYDEYFKRFGGDFGTVIPASFSDEANIHSEGTDTVPFSHIVKDRFFELNGYPLERNIQAVIRDVTFKDGSMPFDRPPEKIRFDYFRTLHTLWIDNFVKPIADWCGKHGIAWTGHDIEHQWPQAHGGRIAPSEQHTYEFRQWPGLDLLLCDHLRDYPTEFDKLEMIEIRSAANQFKKERTLCEAYGAGGYHSTTDDYKRMGDYLLVNGINFFVPHLTLFSYMGQRKRDCPQSFDYRQPWWKEYTEYNDYFARGSYMLTRGRMEQRILLVNPSTTGYLVTGLDGKGDVDHGRDPGCVKNPDMRDFLTLFESLCREMWDFDLGDEFTMEDAARVEDGKLVVGDQRYDAVILSRDTKNLMGSTADTLLEFMRAGGAVISTGDGGEGDGAGYISGMTDDPRTAELRRNWTAAGSVDGLLSLLGEKFEKYVSAEPVTGVGSMRRVLPDGRQIVFIVNHSMGKYSSDVRVKCSSAVRWDMFTGERCALDGVQDNGYFTFRVELERCESLLFVTDDLPAPAEKAPAAKTEEAELELVSIRPDRENTFTLDHPSLEIGDKKFPERYFLETAKTLFHEMMDRGNPWRSTQQHTKYLDMNDSFGPETAFTLTYRFNVAPETVGLPIKAIIERPEKMKLTVNGTEVPYRGEKYYFGEEFGILDVTEEVIPGENELKLSAERFDVLCEVEAVFLEGDFSVSVEDDAFVLTPGRTPGYGYWKDQGMSHYSGSVVYEYGVNLERKPETATLRVADYKGTAASVTVNGKYVSAIHRNGRYDVDVASFLEEGGNKIEVKVCGSLQNVLGPHLNYQDVMPYDWDVFIDGRVAVPEDYMFAEWGMTSPPTLITD